MKKIQQWHIYMAMGCVVAASIYVGLGCFYWPLFLAAGGFTIGYILVDRKYLRCPYCRGFINLDWLFYARNHEYHCSSCGNRVEIE